MNLHGHRAAAARWPREDVRRSPDVAVRRDAEAPPEQDGGRGDGEGRDEVRGRCAFAERPLVLRPDHEPGLADEVHPRNVELRAQLAARERRVRTVSGFRIFVFRSRHDLEANFFVVVPVLCVRTVVGWLPRPELFKVVAFEAAIALRSLLSIRDRILVTAERTVD